VASDAENAEFRGELRAHMANTSEGIDEIKTNARRQAESTDALRQEVTLGFGRVDKRIALIEQAREAHEAASAVQIGACAERFDTLEGKGGSRKRTVAAAAGGGVGITLLLRELWESFVKGVFS